MWSNDNSVVSWADATQWVIQHSCIFHFRSSGRGIMFHLHAAFYHLVHSTLCWTWICAKTLTLWIEDNKYSICNAENLFAIGWWYNNRNFCFCCLLLLDNDEVRIVEKPVLCRSVFFTPFAKLTEGRNTWQIIQSQLLRCNIKCSSILLCPLQRDGKRAP